MIRLGNTQLSPYLSLRSADPLPSEVVAGCYSIWGSCAAGRPRHDDLNKDLGAIPLTGAVGPGTTKRGKANHDFERAVTVAIADTQDKWALLQERLRAKYGPARGGKTICALASDDPVASR